MKASLTLLLACAALLVAGASCFSVHMERDEHHAASSFRPGHTLRLDQPALAHLLPPDGRSNGTGGANGTAGLWGGILAMGQFYAVVGIGEQQFRVQVDTGSSTLAVPTEGCSCGNHSDLPYKRTSATHDVPCSSTEACTFKVSYLDGSGMRGKFYEDTLTLGGLSARGPFGGMQSTSKSFEGRVDGILGAAMSTLNCFPQGSSSCNPTILDTLVATGAMPEDKFGMCLSDRHGRWDLGELDSQYGEGDYKWGALDTLGGFYAVPIQTMTAGGQTIFDYGTSIVVDSGTTLAVLPTDAMQEFETIVGQMNPPGLQDFGNGNGCAVLTDSQVDQWPTITYTVSASGGGTIGVDLGPRHYLVELNGERCFALQTAETGGQHILGDIFMEQFYVAFDRVNGRVGFAPVRECNSIGDPPDATGPWCGGCGGGSNRTLEIVVGLFAVVAVVAVFVVIIARSKRRQAQAAGQPFLANASHQQPSSAHYTQV